MKVNTRLALSLAARIGVPDGVRHVAVTKEAGKFARFGYRHPTKGWKWTSVRTLGVLV